MVNTGYDSSGRVLEHRATGYDLRAGTFVNAEYLDMSIPHAAGALFSTVEDLFLWDRALYTDQLVPRASLEAMFMVNPLLANYGYGVVVGQQFGRRLTGHAGGIHGFLTYLGRYPTERVCVVVLSNLTATKVTDVARVLAAIVFGEEYSVPEERIRTVLAPGICASYASEYQFAPGVVLSVDAEDQQLNATGSGGGRGVFLPESETCFCRKGSDDRMTFFSDEAGKVSHLVLTQEGVEVRADRIR